MAVTLKRKRFAQSYKEPSSDEDVVESDVPYRTERAGPSRRASRRTRLPSVEAEPEPEPRSRAPRRNTTSARAPDAITITRRALRQDKRRVSYRESSDDEDDEDFEVEEEVKEQRPRRRVSQASEALKNKEPRKRVRSAAPRVQKALGAPLKPRTSSASTTSLNIPTDGRTPAWTSLPYHVLLQIFVYASHPLHDENMSPTPAIPWLVKVACMCSAFTKPALTALYRTPPIYAMNQQRRRELVQHLTSPPAEAAYQVMVKRLELDATKMSSSTDPLFDAANISALITSLTTVKEIDIFDPLDRPPYRPRLKRVRRWNYPNELFAALRQSTLLLRSWRWNSLFCVQGPLWMKEIHGDRAFQSLRELTLTKFDPDEKRKPDDGAPTTEELVGSALAVLPNLSSLAFESCKVVNAKLLPMLPSTLVSLEISNCINVFSDDLRAFLLDHGQHLEDLVLNHNQCLAISFLTDLKRSCPRLETLRMDLNYYSSLALSSDNEPLYDWSLELDEIPTWPSTLRVIDMDYLRNWSSDAATNFFASLIDSAEELPDLRELRISAIVDIGWRQRADYRRKWASMFERVFASRSPAPSPHLVSQRAFREWKASQEQGTEKNDYFLDMVEKVRTDEATKSGVQQMQNEALESDSDAPLVSKRKERWNSRRLRTRDKASNYDESSDTDAHSENGLDADEEPKHVQGKCHTVVFRIDNSRPREAVFDEGDFLDDELSGDEDWNGNDVVEDGYAW